MPEIITYHPCFRVTGTNKAIKLGLTDWFGNEEILKKLGRLYGVRTMQELVEKIEKLGKVCSVPKQAIDEGLLTCELCDGDKQQWAVLISPEQGLS